jgi:cytochrome c oxidase subunit 3/cytochrome c oxidase subunit I+III
MNRVTRSMEAQSADAAARVERHRRALTSGLWGTLLFIATEATLFGTLIASYFYLRFQTDHWPPAGIDPPKVTLPLVLTGVLVLATVPMFLASARAKAGRPAPAILLILVAFLVQVGYLAAQIVLFSDDLHKFSPHDTSYGSIYYTLLGAHHLHVLIGLLLDLWVMVRLLGGMTNYRLVAVRVVAFYWYFVSALGVAVVLTQLSPSL